MNTCDFSSDIITKEQGVNMSLHLSGLKDSFVASLLFHSAINTTHALQAKVLPCIPFEEDIPPYQTPIHLYLAYSHVSIFASNYKIWVSSGNKIEQIASCLVHFLCFSRFYGLLNLALVSSLFSNHFTNPDTLNVPSAKVQKCIDMTNRNRSFVRRNHHRILRFVRAVVVNIHCIVFTTIQARGTRRRTGRGKHIGIAWLLRIATRPLCVRGD